MPVHVDNYLRWGLCCCLLLLAGCAGKLPQTLPLSPEREQEATTLWSAFLESKRPSAVDADIRLSWDVLGSKGAIAASLQVQQPALLRFAASDPLGRSLLLAVSDGTTFTMVDSRIGHAYRGRTDSKFWQEYVPEAVAPADLFALLGGFVNAGQGKNAAPAQDASGEDFWYTWQDDRAMRHHVLLARQSGEMRCHLLMDPQGEELLELRYADSTREAQSGYRWPGTVRISGEAITGTLTIQVERVYSHTLLEAATFRLDPPPHFTIEQVD
ncbi:hypothetical protein Despr_2379 [Desulfobulbus propionicus DSM 2032]|jgi:hypothetical protein|uniref:Outer-membrane lipoprotein LolB n=1 Tax=Desulfobulbus propionicus (strain ATCC 33891 / DSM 2032 / VKM B-1956 / 1pr3) TaxID=577650 RepID=A0A7U3YNB2_DESPD|nr:hypothetical protein [Desulfobulbus propionicus]ADW18520.1 hypothetical protein Despr_2379 [Desulfobulbus propionicus DSM 2032]